MGRKKGSKIMVEISDPLIKLLKSGVPVVHACDAVGISPSSYYDWMKLGERATSGQHHEFYLRVKQARAEAIARNVAIIQKAATHTWQAAAWWLERSCPSEFAKRDVEINMTQNNVEINTDETRERITSRINSIAARLKAPEDPE
ncbi:hypothetical protein [Methanolobus halotolerans]|uniref:Uncharacterized protein n=1 Tax=Methanolobus halotolerans TaxID=2052935 RepID=A0A4E0QQC7_9EURY|nr:hypothetical protein [Methanolobus halotolerans]TGC07414.1 hypothetical protein CUN85_11455 [Methanolobus halotolerans]